MSSAGLSKARLARLHDVMAGYVERGEVPGLVALVSRRGETHVEALCMKTLGGSDPVEELLPELADRRVSKRLDGQLNDTEPANRPITLRDLLTFRMGFGIVMAPPGTYPIQTAVDDLRLGQGIPQPSMLPEPDEWIRRFGNCR